MAHNKVRILGMDHWDLGKFNETMSEGDIIYRINILMKIFHNHHDCK